MRKWGGTPAAASSAMAAGWVMVFAAGAVGCVPDIPQDPVPAVMQFEPNLLPPRVPEPTSLIVNQRTGKIDFSLAGVSVPANCDPMAQMVLSPAQCEFYQYLQTLDGYPTTTPGRTPASADLDPATLTAGTNVVVVAGKKAPGTKVAGLQVGFDTASKYATLAPSPSWNVGEFYWAAVRGNADGVKTPGGGPVVGSLPMFLLKQETSLTCDAATPDALDPACPYYALLSQSLPPDMAKASLFQLEPIRQGFLGAGAWDLMAAAGIPKADVAVLWGFPIHSSSVPELDPTHDLVPKPAAADEIRVAVQGPVDPASVSAFRFGGAYGSIVVVDLTTLMEVLAGTALLPAAFPQVTASYADGNVVIKGASAFTAGHQIGLFFISDAAPTNPALGGLRDPSGGVLVASPVSKLLTLHYPLVDENMHSTVSGVADADAKMLEDARTQLGMFFDSQAAGLAGLQREKLVYTFAFAFQAAP